MHVPGINTTSQALVVYNTILHSVIPGEIILILQTRAASSGITSSDIILQNTNLCVLVSQGECYAFLLYKNNT